MEEPNYVLYGNNAELAPKKNYEAVIITKRIIWGGIGLIVVLSLVFWENLFSQMTFFAKSAVILAAIWSIVNNANEYSPVPFEIRFFDDYLIVYCQKMRYNKKVSRMEYYKFFYKDIKKCVYRAKYERIDMYGMEEVTWYDYNKDGTVPERPTYHRSVDSLCFFYTMFDKDIDYVAEIEQHSPIKVTIDN